MTYPNKCCNEPDNMKVIESKPTITVRQCSVCGCKHYEMDAPPMVVGVKGN